LAEYGGGDGKGKSHFISTSISFLSSPSPLSHLSPSHFVFSNPDIYNIESVKSIHHLSSISCPYVGIAHELVDSGEGEVHSSVIGMAGDPQFKRMRIR
jgi:hypothetical protein